MRSVVTPWGVCWLHGECGGSMGSVAAPYSEIYDNSKPGVDLGEGSLITPAMAGDQFTPTNSS